MAADGELNGSRGGAGDIPLGLKNRPYLVGGLEHFLFFHILGIMIPTD